MTKQEQDKLWNDLSEEEKTYKQKEYQELSESRQALDKGALCMLVEIFGEHNLQPTLTYDDVVKEMFHENSDAVIVEMATFSPQHEKKLSALNMLLTTAKYLNKNEDGSDWEPDFDDENEIKWYPCIYKDKIKPHYMRNINWSIVYFRTEELLNQAVQILGEDVIRTALGNY